MSNNHTLISVGLGASALVFGVLGFMQASDNRDSIAELKPVTSMVSALSNKVDTSLSANNATLDSKALEDFIMNNPELLIKSLTKFRVEQEAEGGASTPQAAAPTSDNGKSFADQLLNDSNDPFMGNPTGSHVITVFSDYNCGHCKRLETVFDEWLSVDPEAKLIVKEFPIFRNQPTSRSAAVIGTALFQIDPAKYAKFHKAAMAAYPLSVEALNSIMEDIGVSVDEVKAKTKEAEAQIEKNRLLGVKLSVGGTPTFFINGNVRSGGSNHSVESLMGFFN